MVYRGKPSPGCENCRKAKKRCDLDKPACGRCVKLGKDCSGYRDTSSLQIQDETRAVTQKAERQKAKAQRPYPSQPDTISVLSTPELTDSVGSTPSADLFDLDEFLEDDADLLILPSDTMYGDVDLSVTSLVAAPKPQPDDIATNYFYHQFTSKTHWQFLESMHQKTMDPCLALAIKACGMAALKNVENLPRGREYAQTMYAEALGMLNRQLRDPKQCRTDESLIAVSMLGYYENLTCEGRQSIQSWKAHIKGATQLLKLRGPSQLQTAVGRTLFREIRSQVMIQCIWDDYHPPDFLWDYQPLLEAHTEPNAVTGPIDILTRLCLDFGALRARMYARTISDAQAAQQTSDLDRRFIQWQIDTTASDDRWRYCDLDVPDSPHVWNGRVHAYSNHPIPTVWNTWRSIRIMLSRTQEWLCRRFAFSDTEREEQMGYFRRTRRQMTDEICAAVPVQLGHARPAYTSPCILITAYGSIWPLFFAGTVTFERVGQDELVMSNGQLQPTQPISSAAAQALWILGRMEYISKQVGLRWADGVAATMKGDFHVYDAIDDDLDEPLKSSQPQYQRQQQTSSAAINDGPDWVQEIQRVGRGPRYLIETPNPLSDALNEQNKATKHRRGPIWLGKYSNESDWERRMEESQARACTTGNRDVSF